MADFRTYQSSCNVSSVTSMVPGTPGNFCGRCGATEELSTVPWIDSLLYIISERDCTDVLSLGFAPPIQIPRGNHCAGRIRGGDFLSPVGLHCVLKWKSEYRRLIGAVVISVFKSKQNQNVMEDDLILKRGLGKWGRSSPVRNVCVAKCFNFGFVYFK